VLRWTTLLLVTAALVAVATDGRFSQAAAPCDPWQSTQRAVVRTELVPGSSGGFDWLDAAVGFGLGIVSVALVLVVVAGYRPRIRSTRN
jgi:hypothetical protein